MFSAKDMMKRLGLMMWVLSLGSCGFVAPGMGHEHAAGESTEQARIVDFYRTWHRPKGEYSIKHREPMCCYGFGDKQDCFPVLARKIVVDSQGSHEELMPDVTGASTAAQVEYGDKWYSNAYKVDESMQTDGTGRDSPDGRSHMCIQGQTVVCYVPGWGN